MDIKSLNLAIDQLESDNRRIGGARERQRVLRILTNRLKSNPTDR